MVEEAKTRKYFSIDVETNGPHPVVSSMLSVGACVVGDRTKTFYAEFKPIHKKYELEAFLIGARGLNSLANYDFSKFNPEEVLDLLEERGEDPAEVMEKFERWIKLNSGELSPIFCSTPVKFDSSFVSHYFFTFLGHDPFGYTDENMQSMYRGKIGNLYAKFKDLKLDQTGQHNALVDAIRQEGAFYTTLVFMGQQNKV